MGKKILVTGVTGMIDRALAATLAPDNTVYSMARATDAPLHGRLEDAGVNCMTLDLAADDQFELVGVILDIVGYACLMQGADHDPGKASGAGPEDSLENAHDGGDCNTGGALR